MSTTLVPDGFDVPETFEAEAYRLEVLTPAVGELDYDAVMSSRERLRNVFAPDDSWPAEDMTLAKNIADLRKHETEFRTRVAFAYTMLSPARDEWLGCAYIYPTTVSDYDCEVYLWVRDSARHLDETLHDDLRAWLAASWPFAQPAFPGREISWSEWSGHRHD